MTRITAALHSLRPSLPTSAVFLLGLLLAGCATDYKAVREADLGAINAQLLKTERALAQLEQEQQASRDLLFTAEQQSRAQVIAALKEQVKPPECPVVETSRNDCAADSGQRDRTAAGKAGSTADNQSPDGKLIIGQIENIFMDPPGAVYKARIDTGADTASLDAREVQSFERDGEDWVRFKMPLPGRTDLVDVERRVSRFVRILQSSTDDSERRPVIKMRIVIGTVERLAEFTLSDRQHLEFPILIGRNVLKDTLVVDVSRSDSVSLPKELRNSESAANE